ncbi:hypothetical protein C0993_001731 [Termitomyces sp. T159_Od127]|nr:hypothetical protein C0993_001731 [Termitomyces sp. T159_Od127]
MTPEEQKIVMDRLLKDLQEQRDLSTYGRHNVQLESVADMNALHAQTGTKVIIMAVQALSDAYPHPFVTFTSPHIQDFFYNTYKVSIHDMSYGFEAYSVAGVEEALVGPKTWMVYVNFKEKFTANLGICLEGWPLPRFCSPSDLKTRAEVTLLLGTWKSRTAWFRQMGQEEWKEWREKHEAATSATEELPADIPTTPSTDTSHADTPPRPLSPQHVSCEEDNTTSLNTSDQGGSLPNTQGPAAGATSAGVTSSAEGKQKPIEFVHALGVTSAMGDVIMTAKRQWCQEGATCQESIDNILDM